MLRPDQTVAKGTVLSVIPRTIVGGEPLGKQFCEVTVEHVIRRDAPNVIYFFAFDECLVFLIDLLYIAKALQQYIWIFQGYTRYFEPLYDSSFELYICLLAAAILAATSQIIYR